VVLLSMSVEFHALKHKRVSNGDDVGITQVNAMRGRLTLANTALSFAEATQPVKASNNRVFHAPEGYRRLTINLPEGNAQEAADGCHRAGLHRHRDH